MLLVSHVLVKVVTAMGNRLPARVPSCLLRGTPGVPVLSSGTGGQSASLRFHGKNKERNRRKQVFRFYFREKVVTSALPGTERREAWKTGRRPVGAISRTGTGEIASVRLYLKLLSLHLSGRACPPEGCFVLARGAATVQGAAVRGRSRNIGRNALSVITL